MIRSALLTFRFTTWTALHENVGTWSARDSPWARHQLSSPAFRRSRQDLQYPGMFAAAQAVLLNKDDRSLCSALTPLLPQRPGDGQSGVPFFPSHAAPRRHGAWSLAGAESIGHVMTASQADGCGSRFRRGAGVGSVLCLPPAAACLRVAE